MKISFIILGVLVISCIGMIAWMSYPWSLNEKIIPGEVLHLEPDGMVNNEEFPSVIKVQTWNLGFLYGEGSEGTGYFTRDKAYFESQLKVLVKEIKESAPDIICLQEVDFQSERSHDMNQAQYLAQRASYPYVAEAVSWDANYIPFPYWPFKNHFGRMKSGGAILSKYPILSNEIHLLKKPLSHPWWYNMFYLHRYFQQVEIELGEKKIKLINLHLESFDKVDRLSQSKILAVKAKENGIHIVAGDFNTVPPSALKKRNYPKGKDDYENDPTYQEMQKSEMLEVIPDEIYALDEVRYFTFPAKKPDRRLDYIFFTPDLKMIKAEVLPSALSDHLPLKASFQIANPKFNPYSQ